MIGLKRCFKVEIEKERDNGKTKEKAKRYHIDSISNYNSTKLLVPRNGPNIKERIDIEKRVNSLYNIFM